MSNKLVKKNRFENITFAELGLDEEFNFLEAPYCDCGCGNKMLLVIDDIQQFCGDMLYEDECDWCGLFVIRLNGTVLVTLKTGCTEEDINFMEMKAPHGNYKNIGDIFDEMELHKYGLLVEVRKGEYKIIEE